MWAEGKVRIRDIAEELGVSTATVSHVLHGKTDRVSLKTMQRVQRALQERGYIPNMAATLLAQNDSRIIGVVVNDHEKYEGRPLADPFVAASLNDLAAALGAGGWFMMVKTARDIMEAARFASMWNMDGMVLLGFCASDYQRLRAAIRIPFVVYDGYGEAGPGTGNLRIDDRDGGRQVGRYLRSLGHRRVLCAADNWTCMDLARYEGLCEGLGEAADQLLLPMQQAARLELCRARLPELSRYTAFFAVSDVYAAELMQLARQAGVRVPGQLSVVGFDDEPLCRQLLPALTTVRQDSRRRAEAAVQLLREMRAEPTLCREILLPVELVVRDSTAPAADATETLRD